MESQQLSGNVRSLELNLSIADTEVVLELEKVPDGQERSLYATTALRLGVLALRQARGELDTAAIREAGQSLIGEFKELLADRTAKLSSEMASALRAYFDPSTGTLPQRIESLIRNDGELEKALRSHLAPENSTLARTLSTHLGADSPLFKMLSPGTAESLQNRIERSLESAFAEQQGRILREFSLDSENSAVSRLVKRVRDCNGTLTADLKQEIGGLVGEFSLDKPDSALSRLVKKVETAHDLIGKSLTLDDEGSALARLKRELSTTIEGLTSKNDQFQLEIREAIARLETQKKAAAASTLHGVSFEEKLGNLLAFEVHRLNDVHECTGNSTGMISHCKIGDFVTQLGADSAAPGARIVWEAKSNKSYDVPTALQELDQARKNRRAQIAIFVLAKVSAPEHMEPFQRHGNNLIIVWDADDSSTNILVRAALSVARALVIRETQHNAESTEALKSIESAACAIGKHIGDLCEMKKWSETVRSNGQKISDKAESIRADLEKQVSLLQQQVLSLTTVSPLAA
jgi:hypothetical protein